MNEEIKDIILTGYIFTTHSNRREITGRDVKNITGITFNTVTCKTHIHFQVFSMYVLHCWMNMKI